MKNNGKEFSQFKQLDQPGQNLDAKIDELLALLANTNLDSDKARVYRERLETALNACMYRSVKAYRQLDDEEGSREEMLDKLGDLLASNRLDSRQSKIYLVQRKAGNWLLTLIGLVTILLGMGMIVMPAPADFELYTIFYISANDGVTIMDVVSLLVMLGGVYLVLMSMSKRKTEE